MKTIFLSCVLLASVSASAGRVDFVTQLDGLHALPANSSERVAPGEFFVDDSNHFKGYVGVYDLGFVARVTSIKLYETSDAAVLGTPRFEFTPGVIGEPRLPSYLGGQNFDLNIQISDSDRTALFAGNWWVNLATVDHPNGELRGQITIVPEPSTFSLFSTGIAAFALASRRRIPA